jgi:hypothetical protein
VQNEGNKEYNEEELGESKLLNGMFATYCNDIKIEEYEDEREPELEDDDDFFVAKLEGMIEELKMEKFNEKYAKEENENTQGAEGESEKEMIGKKSKKFKSLVDANDTVMRKEFDEKENDSTIKNQTSAINNSFVKPTMSEVDSKEYLEKRF